jgi:hypothetical protein
MLEAHFRLFTVREVRKMLRWNTLIRKLLREASLWHLKDQSVMCKNNKNHKSIKTERAPLLFAADAGSLLAKQCNIAVIKKTFDMTILQAVLSRQDGNLRTARLVAGGWTRSEKGCFLQESLV